MPFINGRFYMNPIYGTLYDAEVRDAPHAQDAAKKDGVAGRWPIEAQARDLHPRPATYAFWTFGGSW